MIQRRKPAEKKLQFVVGATLDKETYQKLKKFGATLQLTTSSVVRMWIMEKLMEVETPELLLEKQAAE